MNLSMVFLSALACVVEKQINKRTAVVMVKKFFIFFLQFRVSKKNNCKLIALLLTIDTG